MVHAVRRGVRGGLAVVIMLLAAGDARADTFCVKAPSCDGTNRPGVQQAFNAAAANGPGRDRVVLGPREFGQGPYSAESGNPVRVIGAGAEDTVLFRSSNGDTDTVLGLLDAGSRVSKLGVRLGSGTNVTGLGTSGNASHIRVTGSSADPQTGVFTQGSTLSKSTVELPLDSGSTAVGSFGGTIREVSAQGGLGVSALFGSSVHRTRVVAGEFGIVGGTVDQATIELPNGGTALSASGSIGSATLVARHVTAVSGAPAGAVGVHSTASDGFLGGDASVTLENSILRGFESDFLRSGIDEPGPCPPSCDSDADISVSYTVFDPTKVSEEGPGSVDVGPGNLNVNPRFVNSEAGDFHLRPTSPLIDQGSPGLPAKDESQVDLDGNPRVTDGDGESGKRRDMGAFERPKA